MSQGKARQVPELLKYCGVDFPTATSGSQTFDCPVIKIFSMAYNLPRLRLCFRAVLLDPNLNWKAHITELSKKLSRTVGLFYKVRHYAPLETLKLLYYGIFFPFLSYGILFGVLLTVPILI